ncbi:unnamed protein product [Prorocentrum cordatum]|uniref:WSC domain-containing protein n=1 Tax=Prorocentrum cordatum TaxID=2364126 RepID=A0ABN9SR16_9DINO|nr:unnamed protein product [Polarella glacialis]
MQIGWGYNSESCKAACAGSPYMALQGGGWCFCGTSRTQGGLSKRLRDEDCWPACAGESAMEPARPCGGYLSNAVYALDDVQHRAARTHRDGEMAVAYLAMPIVPVAFVLMALCVAPSRRAGSGASAT